MKETLKKFNNIIEYISELDQLEEIFKNVKFIYITKICKYKKIKNQFIII